LLEDYRKITVERKGETNFFTAQMIKNCMKKVIAVNLYESVQVDDELEIKAYYAGHVLGACMFYVKVGDQSAVYTGDYNMTPDRHLGAAWIEKLRPDLFITETTYATMIRDSKRCRERDLLKRIHKCVDNGGKVKKITKQLQNKIFFQFLFNFFFFLIIFLIFFFGLGFNSCFCPWTSSGIMYFIRYLLGTNEFECSNLFCCRSSTKSK
jgi:hypothetical protein